MSEDELPQESIEEGRKLFAGECNFTAGVATLDMMIPEGLPEVAFAGRSNVGKSSLINALTGRKALARTSQTPGRTQQINFFDLGGRLGLVDLPGYGYAKASKSKIKVWNHLIRTYLKGRVSLRRVCVLIDSRHGLKDVDKEIMKMLDDCAVPYQVILTKIDKTKKAELESCIESIEKTISKHPAAFPRIHKTSSAKAIGISELRAILAGLT